MAEKKEETSANKKKTNVIKKKILRLGTLTGFRREPSPFRPPTFRPDDEPTFRPTTPPTTPDNYEFRLPTPPPHVVIDYNAQLAHALKEGFIILNITKCLFQGPPRVGKTHVKCLLLKEKLEKQSTSLSTPCAEHPQRAIRNVTATAYAGTKRDEQWELMDDELLEDMISKVAIKLKISHEDDDSRSTRNISTRDIMDSLSKKIKKISRSADHHYIAISPAQASHGKNSKKDLLYFVDSGGQPQFQEVLQAFIPNTDVLLLAFNLTQKLSDSPLIRYQTEKGTHTLGKYAISNEEIISRFARMVHSSNSNVHVGLIGTHRDQYSPDEHETIEQKNERLLQIFSFCNDRLLYSDIVSRSLLFPVNALQAEDGVFDDPVVCHLRNAINFVLDNVQEVEVPLRWYAFELAMQRYSATEGTQVLSMDMCVRMSKDLKFPEMDVPVAMEFLAKYNLILYYPSILPYVVFTSPQVLLDKVTELTECVYVLDAGRTIPIDSHSSQVPPPSGEYLIMKDEGVITNDIFKHFDKHYKAGLFTFENLIEILQYLYIISRRDDGRYFMPALLSLFTPSELSHLYDPSKPPLLFDFIEGCAPTGLFCALLVCLTSPNCGWKVGHHLESSPLKGVRSNAACLIDSNSIMIILVDSFRQFEVHYRCHAEEEKFLPHIKYTITSALEEVISNRKFNISFPQIGFWCEASHPRDPPRHICTMVNKRLKCSINPMADCKMIPSIVQWMASLLPLPRQSTSTEEKPTLQKLLRYCREVAHRWFEVGIELEVSHSKLTSIQSEKNDDIARLVEVFASWQSNPSSDRPFTWQTMEDVLRDIKENALADKIRDKYNN